jgi:hypothetical protein
METNIEKTKYNKKYEIIKIQNIIKNIFYQNNIYLFYVRK